MGLPRVPHRTRQRGGVSARGRSNCHRLVIPDSKYWRMYTHAVVAFHSDQCSRVSCQICYLENTAHTPHVWTFIYRFTEHQYNE